MGEAIISRAGSGNDGSGVKWVWKLKTEIVTENKEWTMPSQVRNDEVSVFLFGGGGGTYNEDYTSNGNATGGGGGGWMNNGVFTVASGSQISITVGSAGYNSSGGITSFGSWLSANGGSKGYMNNGGNGGSGGGSATYGAKMVGGIGYQFGGGGGTIRQSTGGEIGLGGNGGKWGGAGGHVGSMVNNSYAYYQNVINNKNYLQSGLGVSGYLDYINASGKNNFVGNIVYPTAGENRSLDDDTLFFNIPVITKNGSAGASVFDTTRLNNRQGFASGGGGGYFCKGGDGSVNSDGGSAHREACAGGGGGGYGCNGYKGRAYYNGNVAFGGGGGGYGPSAYGRGATGTAYDSGNHLSARPGICIIQYYQLTAT